LQYDHLLPPFLVFAGDPDRKRKNWIQGDSLISHLSDLLIIARLSPLGLPQQVVLSVLSADPSFQFTQGGLDGRNGLTPRFKVPGGFHKTMVPKAGCQGVPTPGTGMTHLIK